MGFKYSHKNKIFATLTVISICCILSLPIFSMYLENNTSNNDDSHDGIQSFHFSSEPISRQNIDSGARINTICSLPCDDSW